MEKVSFVKNGVLRLPPGFRFHPTDEELVVQYLKRKVFSYPFPASIIPEADICKSDPWDLPGDLEKERYFFSRKEAKYPNGNRSNRSTNSGYWKATGIDKRIVSSKENQFVGMKKTLVFYRGKPPHGNKTNWIMHEYRLAGGGSDGDDNWVLCRIFPKKRGSSSSKNGEERMINDDRSAVRGLGKTRKVLFYNFMADKGGVVSGSGSSSSSSSDSSGITAELYQTHEKDGMEEISGCNTLMLFQRKPI